MRIFQFSTSIYGDGTFCVSDNDSSEIRKVSLSVCERMILDLLENDPKLITFSNKGIHQTIFPSKNKNTILKDGNKEEEILDPEQIGEEIDKIVEEFVSADFGNYLCIIFAD